MRGGDLDFRPFAWRPILTAISEASNCGDPGSPIPLVLWDKFHPEILMDSAERGRQTKQEWGKLAIF